VSFVALMGVAALSDAPHGPTDVSVESESIRLAEPAIAAEQPARPPGACRPGGRGFATAREQLEARLPEEALTTSPRLRRPARSGVIGATHGNRQRV
jgi:hypothetical protein